MSGYVRQDEMRCVPGAEFGEVRAEVGRDETGYTPSDERPQVVRDEPRSEVRSARQETVAAAV